MVYGPRVRLRAGVDCADRVCRDLSRFDCSAHGIGPPVDDPGRAARTPPPPGKAQAYINVRRASLDARLLFLNKSIPCRLSKVKGLSEKCASVHDYVFRRTRSDVIGIPQGIRTATLRNTCASPEIATCRCLPRQARRHPFAGTVARRLDWRTQVCAGPSWPSPGVDSTPSTMYYCCGCEGIMGRLVGVYPGDGTSVCGLRSGFIRYSCDRSRGSLPTARRVHRFVRGRHLRGSSTGSRSLCREGESERSPEDDPLGAPRAGKLERTGETPA